MKYLIPCLDALLLSFDKDHPGEQVRVLLGTGTGTPDDPICVERFAVVPNRSTKPDREFMVNVHDVLPDDLPHVVGVAHTHPVGRGYEPSYSDVVHMPPGRLGVIWTPGSGCVTYYSNDGYLTHTTWRRTT